MDIITNKPAKAPLIELFPDNNIKVRLSFPDGYNMSGLEAKIYRKLDNTIISDISKQPEILVEGQLLSVIFTSDKIKLLSSPFILYIYDNDAAIISFDCVTSNKSGEYQDIITQVVIGDETIVEVNAQLNNINFSIINNTTIPLTKSVLNSTYGSQLKGSIVFAPNITSGGIRYEKYDSTSTSDWYSTSILIVT